MVVMPLGAFGFLYKRSRNSGELSSMCCNAPWGIWFFIHDAGVDEVDLRRVVMPPGAFGFLYGKHHYRRTVLS